MPKTRKKKKPAPLPPGKVLRAARLAAGLTLREVAEQCDFKRGHVEVAEIERGKNALPITRVARMAVVLEVSVGELACDEEELTG